MPCLESNFVHVKAMYPEKGFAMTFSLFAFSLWKILSCHCKIYNVIHPKYYKQRSGQRTSWFLVNLLKHQVMLEFQGLYSRLDCNYIFNLFYNAFVPKKIGRCQSWFIILLNIKTYFLVPGNDKCVLKVHCKYL